MSEFIQQLVDLERSAPAVWRAVLLSVKASLILALTALVVLGFARLSASKRHMIWAAGIVAALLLPFAWLALPAWRLALRYSDSVPNEVREPAPSTGVPVVITTQASLERPGIEVRARESAAGSLGATPDRNGAPALLALWILGLAVAAWPWLAGIRARARLANSASDLLPACWERSLTALGTDGHVPPRTRVLVADACTMPMTWGYARPIVLLPRQTHWSDDERRNALLHEFAHVRRADYLVKCTARLLCVLHWFNPFVWLAARAERLAREEACDDAVLRAGSRPSLYAQQLFDIARRGAQPRFAVASLTMARQSNLARRLRSILAPALDRSPGGRRWPLASALAVAVVLPPVATLTPEWMRVAAPSHAGQASPLFATALSGSNSAAAPARAPRAAATRDLQNARNVPSAQDVACVPASGKRGSTSMQVNDSRSGLSSWRIKWSDGSCILELDARGTFTLSPNADDIVTIASGGHFELRHDDGRTERRVRLEPRSGGTMDREYTVNRRRTEWSDDAARWFAGALIALDRRTAFAVDARFPVLWQQGGFDAVQAEVERMPSAHARRVYYRKLFEQQPPTTAQITRVLASAAPFFDSAHDAAELLLLVAKQPAFAEPAHLAYAQMARGIQSDYERRRSLTALLARDDLKPDVVRTMLDATVGMKSDFELSELLLGIDRRYAVSDETRPYYLRALSTIGSNYEQRRVMSAIIRGDGLSAAVTGEIIGIAERTMKGYELAELLVGIADKGTLDAAASAAYLRATTNVASDYERRRVLNALLQRKDLPGAVVAGILAAAATIRSDYECAELLVTVARAVKIDDALRPSFDRAAATIDSEYEYGRAMAAARRSAAQ